MTHQITNGWSNYARSPNISVKMQSRVCERNHQYKTTDCIRGKQGYSEGVHVWNILWDSSKHGSHPVIGVGTQAAPLTGIGYRNVVGSDSDSFGWNLKQQQIIHRNVRSNYPVDYYLNEVLCKIMVILDLEDGTLAFACNGKYLGVAFDQLDSVHSPLYPMVNLVYGGCQVKIEYLHNQIS